MDDLSALTENVAEISADLLTIMVAFVQKHPDFKVKLFISFSCSFSKDFFISFKVMAKNIPLLVLAQIIHKYL